MIKRTTYRETRQLDHQFKNDPAKANKRCLFDGESFELLVSLATPHVNTGWLYIEKIDSVSDPAKLLQYRVLQPLDCELYLGSMVLARITDDALDQITQMGIEFFDTDSSFWICSAKDLIKEPVPITPTYIEFENNPDQCQAIESSGDWLRLENWMMTNGVVCGIYESFQGVKKTTVPYQNNLNGLIVLTLTD